jgi:hypothetical protein
LIVKYAINKWLGPSNHIHGIQNMYQSSSEFIFPYNKDDNFYTLHIMAFLFRTQDNGVELLPGLFVLTSLWLAFESVLVLLFTWPLARLSAGMGRGVMASFPWGFTRDGLQPIPNAALGVQMLDVF